MSYVGASNRFSTVHNTVIVTASPTIYILFSKLKFYTPQVFTWPRQGKGEMKPNKIANRDIFFFLLSNKKFAFARQK